MGRPRFLVLCAFGQFEVWEPGRYPSEPVEVFALNDLVDRYQSLLFLAGDEPIFGGPGQELTKAATQQMASLYRALLDRNAAETAELQRWILQTVWCLFAEDPNPPLLRDRPVTRIVDGLRRDHDRSSAAELGHLFTVLNMKDRLGNRGGVYAGAPYANGGLFAVPALVHLGPRELDLLAEACTYNWAQVDPTIFGSLMESFLGREHRWALGAHYTYESDIMRIVRPTIVEPWAERIAGASTPGAAEAVLSELVRFEVLDPACGCGNFLYLAYRELRALERRAKDRIADLYEEAGAAPPADLPGYPLANVHGIEIDPFAVLIARVTLWMGHKLTTDRFGLVEPVLPLVDLSNVRQDDALWATWPPVDAILGNPPFHGSQHLRGALGDDYVNRLRSEFGFIKDYCVYWFRRAHDHLPEGGRAGLVGTNSISQNRARDASLDHLSVNGGVITDAVSSQDWPGEAVVKVSLVNWIKEPPTMPSRFVLDGHDVEGITTSLRSGLPTAPSAPLAANRGRCFQGPIPVGGGFLIGPDEAAELLADPAIDHHPVVRRYLVGDDIASSPLQEPSRWIIDFGARTLEEAQRWPRALEIVRERVKPERDTNNRRSRRERWWLFGELAVGMRRAIAGLPRYAAALAQGKRLLVTWCGPSWCPSNLVYVFAIDDAYRFGVLSSSIHEAWARSQSSTLRGDLRYTPTSAFETYPFPQPTDDGRNAIARAGDAVVALRRRFCTAGEIGLTTLYNRVHEGGYAEPGRAHHELDHAVTEAYGWVDGPDTAEVVRRLAARNAELSADPEGYQPFDPLPAAPMTTSPQLDFG